MHCCFAEKKLEKKILPKIMPLLQKYRKYADLNEIISAEEQKSNIVSIQEAKQRYTQLLDMDIENIYSTLNDNEKRKLWHSFIDRIVIKSYDEIDIFLL